MPARTCQRTRRRNAPSSTRAVDGERGDEGGERSTDGRAGGGDAASDAGHGCRLLVGGLAVRRRDRRDRRSCREQLVDDRRRTDGCPASAAQPWQPVGRGEHPGRVCRSVASRQPELDRLAGGVEPDDVHPRRRAGAEADDLELVGGGWRCLCLRNPTLRGVPLRDAAGEVSRAVPDGRSALARRCHSRTYGSNSGERPNRSTAASTSRTNSATPRLKFEATTATAPRSRRTRHRPRGGRSSQPVVAMTRRRHPPSRAASTFGSTCPAARRFDDDVGAGEGRRVVATRRGPPESCGRRVRRVAQASCDRPCPGRRRRGSMFIVWSLQLFWGSRPVGGTHKKAAVTVVVSAALGSLRARRPMSVVVRAVRAPGPVPPGRAARASSSTRSRRCSAWCKSYA